MSNETEDGVISKISRPYGPNRTVDLNLGSVIYSVDLGQAGNVDWPECLTDRVKYIIAEEIKDADMTLRNGGVWSLKEF